MLLNRLWFAFKNAHIVKKIIVSLVLLLAIMIAIISAFIATEKGSRWLVLNVARMVDVRINNMHGNLLTGLDLASIDYQKNDVSIHAEKISFRWQPMALFYADVSVQSFAAENIRVHLPVTKNEPEPDVYVWPSFAQPVSIEFDSIKLRNIQIYQAQQSYLITSVEGSLALGRFRLQATDFKLVSPEAKLVVNGSLGVRYPYKLNLANQWQFKSQTPNSIGWMGEVKLAGDIKSLDIKHELLVPLQIKTVGKIAPALHDKNQKPFVDVVNDWSDQALMPELLQQLNPDGKIHFLNSLRSTRGHLQVNGWLDAYTFSGSFLTSMTDADLLTDIDASGVVTNTIDAQKKSTTAASLHVEKLRISASAPSEIPQPASPVTVVPTGMLPNIAPAPMKNMAPAANKPLDNNFLLVTGDLTFLPNLQWNVKLTGEHVNLGQFIADWPSDLHAQVISQGEIISSEDAANVNNWRFDFSKLDVNGKLRQHQVLAQGELHFDGKHWSSSTMALAVGDNTLSLKGQAGNDVALEWKLNAPALNQLDPGLRGNIISNGVLSGDINEPRVRVNVQANQFDWQGYGANKLSLAITPRAVGDNYDVLLDATDVKIQEQFIRRLAVKGNGSIAQHDLAGDIESPAYGVVEFGLASGWKDNVWRGQFRDLKISSDKIPRWTMTSSAPMQADKSHADIGKLCLTTTNNLPLELEKSSSNTRALQETPAICLQGNWDQHKGASASATISAAPLSALRAWSKPEVTLAGVIDGDMKFRADIGAPMQLDANLQTRDAKLLYQFQGGNVETYTLQKGSANVLLKNNVLTAAIEQDWGAYGTLGANLQYSLKDKKVQGKGTVVFANLAPLEGLLPFLNDVKGSATGNINLAGSVENPEITGSFNLVDGSANLPKLGLVLKNISYQITSPSINSAHVEGKITSGDGTLVTQGDFIHLGSPDWHWQANVFGADIRIIEQAQLTANISPNLKLSANAQSIELTGSTEIPWARANVKNLPESATRVSHDVVIVEKDTVSAATIAKKSLPFHTNVILYFGDEVRFKGFGLDTRLTGKANVLKEENRQMFTTGFVAVEKGIYKAYGQELSIERGRLIFQGPYDNPGLDIRAVREMEDDVVAGLDIGGTLQHPKSSVFAIPARTDSDAMAMLITGKALSQSSKEDAYAIIGAIGKLGMSQGDSMSADIAHKVGLDEVRVQADGGLEQSALWIGKYLTPKLFVHYVVGLFDQAFGLGMTYKINDKIHLEAESGKTQSVDVIYKIER